MVWDILPRSVMTVSRVVLVNTIIRYMKAPEILATT
jgi:hypothetical protein